MTWNLTPIKKTLQVKQKRKIGQLHDFYSGQCQEKGLVISKEFFFQDHSKSQVFRKAIEYCKGFLGRSLNCINVVNMADKTLSVGLKSGFGIGNQNQGPISTGSTFQSENLPILK